jgi:hypothetical protein
MATTESPAVGVAHVTVVPANFDPETDACSSADQRSSDGGE